MGKRVIWSPEALAQLTDARKTILDISKSLKSANRLAREIFESTDVLADQPEMYPLDKNKHNNEYLPLLRSAPLQCLVPCPGRRHQGDQGKVVGPRTQKTLSQKGKPSPS